jgi:hypothetical protein
MWDEGRDASLLNRPRRNPPHHQQNDGTALSPVRESGIATQDHAAIDSGVDPWKEKQPSSLRLEFPPPPRRSVSSSESDSAASAQGPTPRHQHPQHHQPTHPLSSLAHDPAFVQCPHCHTQALTRTEKRSSERNSGLSALLCPCFTSPSGSCDTYHHCGGCNAVLVIVSHDGQVTVVPVPGAAGGVNIVQRPPPVAVSPVSPCEKKKGDGDTAGRESREYRSELEGGGEREIKEAPSGSEGVNVKEIRGPPVEIGSSM